MAGFSFVSTTMPPTTACRITPPGSVADSQTRSRRRCPPTRYRHAAMNTRPAIATSGKLSSRLPNSIDVFSRVCPGERAATRLALVHCGQSGQPSPEELSRTAAPVAMMTVLAITPASVRARIDDSVGDSTGAASRAR
jgi:hypothetical protein